MKFTEQQQHRYHDSSDSDSDGEMPVITGSGRTRKTHLVSLNCEWKKTLSGSHPISLLLLLLLPACLPPLLSPPLLPLQRTPRVNGCCLSKVVIFAVVFVWTLFILWVAMTQINSPQVAP